MMKKLVCTILLAHASTYSVAGDVVARNDHYNPVVLNEHALERASKGDTTTALVLLERAALLAPYDAEIQRNLATLRAWRDGSAAPVEPGTASPTTPETQARAEVSALPPFPLWPKK